MAFRSTTRPSGKAQVSPVKLGKGMLDMFAGAARGATRASLGLPGDIETLGRMGYGWATDTEMSKNFLPNTEDFDKILPPVTPGQKNPFDELGGYVGGIPVWSAGAKGAVTLGKNFQKVMQPKGGAAPASMSRREFLKTTGAVAATAAIGATAGKVLSKLDQPAVEAVKAAEKVPAAVRKYEYESLEGYVEGLKGRANSELGGDVSQEILDQRVRSLARADELEYNVSKQKLEDGIYVSKEGHMSDKFGEPVLDADLQRVDWLSPKAKKEMKDFKTFAEQAGDEFLDWSDLIEGYHPKYMGRAKAKAIVGAGIGGTIVSKTDDLFGMLKKTELGDVILTKSAKNPDKYQMTFFEGKAGQSPTTRDVQFDTKEEAIKAFKKQND